jgi:Protein of unknown function (DUF3347)
MRKSLAVLSVLTLAGGLAVVASAAETSAFATIAGHYETIRQALLHDGITGVAPHARAIAEEVAALEQRFDTGTAGVAGEQAGACQQLLPEIAAAAKKLADAKDLAAARAAFAALSEPMVRYREMVSGERPIVVYCPMEKKSWLQPAGDIGNPYLGQEMASCGEVVSR